MAITASSSAQTLQNKYSSLSYDDECMYIGIHAVMTDDENGSCGRWIGVGVRQTHTAVE
jgi:hypothetical protein